MSLPQLQPYPLPTEAELPKNKGPWSPEASRAALLIHDMQRYFARIFPAGESPLAPAVANIARLAAHCRAKGIPVFYTAQIGNQDRRDRGLQADLWGPGMSHTPEHEEILPELTPEPGDFQLVKHRYSAFQRSNLESLMRARGRDQLIVTGIYAHIGCLMSASEAFQRDIEAFMVADALADFSRAEHDMALTWAAGRCAGVVSTDQILSRLV